MNTGYPTLCERTREGVCGVRSNTVYSFNFTFAYRGREQEKEVTEEKGDKLKGLAGGEKRRRREGGRKEKGRVGRGKARQKIERKVYMDGEVQTSRNFQRAKVSSKTRAVPAGRFQRRVNYTTPREKREERKKKRTRAGQHTLNVN